MNLYEAFAQGRERGTERRTKRTLAEYVQPALGGDQQALGQIYSVDPDIGYKVQGMAREQRQQDYGELVRVAQYYRDTGDPNAYGVLRQQATRLGPQFAGLPERIDTEEDRAGSMKFADALVGSFGDGKGNDPRVHSTFVSDGRIRVLGNDFSVRDLGPADIKAQFLKGEDGYYRADLRGGTATPVTVGPAPAPMGAPQPMAPQPGRQLDPVNDFKALTAQFPGVQVTSLRRDPAKNQSVDGKSNSFHLTGEAGDFVVPQEQKAAFMQRAQAMGYQAIDEGDHIHLEPPKRGITATQFGGGQPAAPLRPYQAPITPYQQEQLALAREAAARAGRAEQRAEAVFQREVSAPPKLDEAERAAAGYKERMVQAEQILGEVESQGYEPGNYRDYLGANNSGLPIIGPAFNAVTSPQGQKYRQAQEDWVRAKLRRESGAVIGDEEMAREIRMYFPQPGDSPAVIRQKAEARKQAIQQLDTMAGRAGGGVPGQRPTGQAPQRPAPQPAPQQPAATRRVRYNPATGEFE